MNIKIENLSKHCTPRNLVILIFAVHLVLGLFIFRDYGISKDEVIERQSTLVSYVHIFGGMMRESGNQNVRHVANSQPELMEWFDRYYGVALQMLPMAVEHINGFEMTSREIFLVRHLFTFLNFFAAGIFFYLILRRRFGDNYIPLMGVLFFILSPRFFAESFYNIKDLLFFSWCVIASYYALRWMDDVRNYKRVIPAALTLAIATNTRILGISILLLACGFVLLYSIKDSKIPLWSIGRIALLVAATFVFYVMITPLTWGNPLGGTIDIFMHFVEFPNWHGIHLYLGEMIGVDNLPWHYIPVWMGVTIQPLYILLFFAGLAAVAVLAARWVLKKSNAQQPHMHDLFFAAMFIFTFAGFIVLGIRMHSGWRHVYSVYLPFLYMAVFGLERAFAVLSEKGRNFRLGLTAVVAVALLHSAGWMAANHPYQYAYFNFVGRHFAQQNYFPLDYWGVSRYDLVRYAIAHDGRPQISISFEAHSGVIHQMMTEEEKERAIFTDPAYADYYIEHSYFGLSNEGSSLERAQRHGFRELYSINVDGMAIATLFERVEVASTS